MSLAVDPFKLALVPEVGGQPDKPKRKLTGHSPIHFAQQKINPDDTLLGNRWLCRGGGVFIVAPSGHGKSVLTAQAAIEWGCGRVSFGIKPAKALRSLVIQAEDDEGDIIEMSRIVDHLKLTSDERSTVASNVHIESVRRSKFRG
jgi:AAA domain